MSERFIFEILDLMEVLDRMCDGPKLGSDPNCMHEHLAIQPNSIGIVNARCVECGYQTVLSARDGNGEYELEEPGGFTYCRKEPA